MSLVQTRPVQPTQPPAVLVAIDIAKLRHDVLIEAPGWKSRKRMILPNTAAEFRLFADFFSWTEASSARRLRGHRQLPSTACPRSAQRRLPSGADRFLSRRSYPRSHA